PCRPTPTRFYAGTAPAERGRETANAGDSKVMGLRLVLALAALALVGCGSEEGGDAGDASSGSNDGGGTNGGAKSGTGSTGGNGGSTSGGAAFGERRSGEATYYAATGAGACMFDAS